MRNILSKIKVIIFAVLFIVFLSCNNENNKSNNSKDSSSTIEKLLNDSQTKEVLKILRIAENRKIAQKTSKELEKKSEKFKEEYQKEIKRLKEKYGDDIPNGLKNMSLGLSAYKNLPSVLNDNFTERLSDEELLYEALNDGRIKILNGKVELVNSNIETIP